MRLTMKQRQAVTAVTVERYRQGSKKVKQNLRNLAARIDATFATPREGKKHAPPLRSNSFDSVIMRRSRRV
jgi:hypothetical protein